MEGGAPPCFICCKGGTRGAVHTRRTSHGGMADPVVSRDSSRVPLRPFVASPPTGCQPVGICRRAQGHRGPRSADHPCGGHRESNQRMVEPVCWEAMVKGRRSGKPHDAWCPWGCACGCDLSERKPLTGAPTSRVGALTSPSDVSARRWDARVRLCSMDVDVIQTKKSNERLTFTAS